MKIFNNKMATVILPSKISLTICQQTNFRKKVVFSLMEVINI